MYPATGSLSDFILLKMQSLFKRNHTGYEVVAEDTANDERAPLTKEVSPDDSSPDDGIRECSASALFSTN
jgi:hypothetical protein